MAAINGLLRHGGSRQQFHRNADKAHKQKSRHEAGLFFNQMLSSG
jgi:hypothetical protein